MTVHARVLENRRTLRLCLGSSSIARFPNRAIREYLLRRRTLFPEQNLLWSGLWRREAAGIGKATFIHGLPDVRCSSLETFTPRAGQTLVW